VDSLDLGKPWDETFPHVDRSVTSCGTACSSGGFGFIAFLAPNATLKPIPTTQSCWRAIAPCSTNSARERQRSASSLR
jgi:hypothetical protein